MNALKSIITVNKDFPKTKESLLDWHIAVLQSRLKDLKSSKEKAIDFDKAMEQIKSELRALK